MKGNKQKPVAAVDTAPIKRNASLQKIDTTVPDEGCGRAELMRRNAERERERIAAEPAPKKSTAADTAGE